MGEGGREERDSLKPKKLLLLALGRLKKEARLLLCLCWSPPPKMEAMPCDCECDCEWECEWRCLLGEGERDLWWRCLWCFEPWCECEVRPETAEAASSSRPILLLSFSGDLDLAAAAEAARTLSKTGIVLVSTTAEEQPCAT